MLLPVGSNKEPMVVATGCRQSVDMKFTHFGGLRRRDAILWSPKPSAVQKNRLQNVFRGQSEESVQQGCVIKGINRLLMVPHRSTGRLC